MNTPFQNLALIATVLFAICNGASAYGQGGKYIVVLKKEANSTSESKLESLTKFLTWGGVSIDRTYSYAINGVSVSGLVAPLMLQQVRRHTAVDYIEPDFDYPYTTLSTDLITESFVAADEAASWGLDRIDQEDLPLDGIYNPGNVSGKGVQIFIVSTGINRLHSELRGKLCFDAVGGGTFMAGTVAGRNYGVAKGASLIAINIYKNRTTSLSKMLSAIDSIVHAKFPSTPAVALLDAVGPESIALNLAVNAAVNAGVVMVVPAGDASDVACFFSPASTEKAITVSGTTSYDRSMRRTNYGSCVDIAAPGKDIQGPYFLRPLGGVTQLSSSSVSAAFVAGVAALYLEIHPEWSPEEVWAAMKADAVVDKVSNQATASTGGRLVPLEPSSNHTWYAKVNNITQSPTSAPIVQPGSLLLVNVEKIARG